MTGRVLPFLLLMPLLAIAGARAETAPATDAATIVASAPWIRDAPPTAAVRAGYVTLRNDGTAARTITGATSACFGAIEIHEMHDVDGVARMRRVPRLEVPAGGTVALAPGGLHLMLFRPQRPLRAGEHCTIDLALDGGGTVAATFVVRAP